MIEFTSTCFRAQNFCLFPAATEIDFHRAATTISKQLVVLLLAPKKAKSIVQLVKQPRAQPEKPFAKSLHKSKRLSNCFKSLSRRQQNWHRSGNEFMQISFDNNKSSVTAAPFTQRFNDACERRRAIITTIAQRLGKFT